MLILITISLFILIALSTLFVPIQLVINSKKSQYLIKVPLYFSARLVPANQLFLIKLKLFQIPVTINPLKSRKNKPNESIQENKNKVPKAIRGNFLRFHKAFTVKKLHIDIDTGNFPLNAQLMPLTLLSNNSNINLNINFENRNTADINIHTRLYKILIIRASIKSTK